LEIFPSIIQDHTKPQLLHPDLRHLLSETSECLVPLRYSFEPIRFGHYERVEVTRVNDAPMVHPMMLKTVTLTAQGQARWSSTVVWFRPQPQPAPRFRASPQEPIPRFGPQSV
jgi:hypothetical protein